MYTGTLRGWAQKLLGWCLMPSIASQMFSS
jgi:hypothetical protein